MVRSVILFSASLAVLLPATSHAEALHHETEYRVSIAGLPIAHADFKTEFENGHFTIDGDIDSSGLARLVKTIKANAKVSGTIGSNRLEAARYTLDYTSGKKRRVYDVVYQDGSVSSTTITPPPKRSDTWIPVTPDDLHTVLDPIGGLIFPASVNICSQTLPVFDGETRMDLKLSSKGRQPFTTDGFKGEAIVCGVRFMPRSGFKKNRDDFEYLQKSDGMEIWFAKADAMNVYAPVYVRVPTKYGTLTITAIKYGT